MAILLAFCTSSLYIVSNAVAAIRIISQTSRPTDSPLTASLTADEGTNRGGLSRDGWYPEASELTPANVATGGFGQLFSVPVTGEVYAQPVMDGPNAIVATEQNWVYAISQATGAREWAIQVGANVGAQPFNDQHPTVASYKPWGCGNIAPYIGITSTPVVDPSTGIIYVVALEQLPNGSLGYFMNALNPANGKEEPNFPVEVKGTAQNNPDATFSAYHELQRPALTLTRGVIYFGFSSHCTNKPYEGYVAGISQTGRMTALWSDLNPGTSTSAGIWQSGGGFASDASGQIIIATGNANEGSSPSGNIPGSSPPKMGSLGESVVRLVAQKNGSLKATDFFTPDDAALLDDNDLDTGSGAPVLLPPQFGTTSDPELLVQDGKSGYVYLLNAKNLGGVSPGNAGALAVQGPNGSTLATPGVWPGDGGYIYIPTVNSSWMTPGGSVQGAFNVYQVSDPTTETPSFGLNLVATGPEDLGFGSSSPIVTSDGMASGSAVVWVVALQPGGGGDAELQAYNAVPNAGTSASPGVLTLINQWPVTNATTFAVPGVGDNRLFVPTSNNQLLIFGLPPAPVISGRGTTFKTTTIGKTNTASLSFVAQSSFTISEGADGCGICNQTTQFAVGGTNPAFVNGVLNVSAGQTFTVDAKFKPTGLPGYRSDVLRMVTSSGEVDFPLIGTARAAGSWVQPSTYGLTLHGYTVGQSHPSASTLTFTNFGSKAAVITRYDSSVKPFSVRGLPPVGSTLVPGASFTARVTFSSRSPGSFHHTLAVSTKSLATDATSDVKLSAVASRPPVLSIQPSSLELRFGSPSSPVSEGTPLFQSVTVSNHGGSVLTFSSSASGGSFVLTNPTINEEVLPDKSLTLNVLFLPDSNGAVEGSLILKAIGLPAKTISLTGYGTGTGATISAPSNSGWQFAGGASMVGSTLVLTTVEQAQTGSAFTLSPVTSDSLTVNYTTTAEGGTGGDREGLILADSSELGSGFPLVPLGGLNGEAGFGGTAGIAIVTGENEDPGTTSDRWVLVANGFNYVTGALSFIGTPVNLEESTQDTPNDVTVSLQNSSMSVWVDGIKEIDEPVDVPASFFMGFTGVTGLQTDEHEISNVSIVVGGGGGISASYKKMKTDEGIPPQIRR